MKIIATEEHFITPEVRAALGRLEGDVRDDSVLLNGIIGVDERLAEIGDERLRLMDASGVDVQTAAVRKTPFLLLRQHRPVLERESGIKAFRRIGVTDANGKLGRLVLAELLERDSRQQLPP